MNDSKPWTGHVHAALCERVVAGANEDRANDTSMQLLRRIVKEVRNLTTFDAISNAQEPVPPKGDTWELWNALSGQVPDTASVIVDALWTLLRCDVAHLVDMPLDALKLLVSAEVDNAVLVYMARRLAGEE